MRCHFEILLRWNDTREEGKFISKKIGDVTVPSSDNDTITSLTRFRAVSKILSALSFLFFCFESKSILGTSKAPTLFCDRLVFIEMFFQEQTGHESHSRSAMTPTNFVVPRQNQRPNESFVSEDILDLPP